MSFTRSTTNTTVHQQMPDYPSNEGYIASQLKTAFDAPATGLKTDLNNLMTELEDTSAASSIGVASLDEGDTSDPNLQAKLGYILGEAQSAVLGQIPDGTITKAKLNDDYSAIIAEKDGTLQTGLNSEQINGKTEAQLKASFLGTSNPTVLSYTGAEKQTETTTESKTVTTTSRFLLMIFANYGNCHLALYDAQTEKFIFATYIGRYPEGSANSSNTFAFNTSSIKLRDGNYKGNVTLTATRSVNTISINMTKAPSDRSDGENIPAGTITVLELGGIVS